MPELPEVETVARELKSIVINKKIISIEALWHKSVQFETDKNVVGQKIIAIERKGKYLILVLSETFLVVHLRMTGQLIDCQDFREADLNDYIRAYLHFEDGSALLFKDVRKFGRIYHTEDVHQFLAHVGIDALDPRMTKPFFYEGLQKSRLSVKAFLMAQKHVSGMGNIYTDEALFLSQIYPEVKTKEITKKKSDDLYENMLHVLNKSIRNMGSTISDYRDPAGNAGTNQNYFFVYGREGLECQQCGTEIEKIKLAGRGTHFCPQCQKKFT